MPERPGRVVAFPRPDKLSNESFYYYRGHVGRDLAWTLLTLLNTATLFNILHTPENERSEQQQAQNTMFWLIATRSSTMLCSLGQTWGENSKLTHLER